MRKALLSALLTLCYLCAISQNSNKELNERHQQTDKLEINLDSLTRMTQQIDSEANMNIQFSDSLQRARDMDNNVRNLTALSHMMDERNEKQKKEAMWRIGIGVGLLALGIVAFLRRRKTS